MQPMNLESWDTAVIFVFRTKSNLFHSHGVTQRGDCVIVEQFNISHVRRSGSLASVVTQANGSSLRKNCPSRKDRDRERRTHMRDFQRWGKEIHPVRSLPRLQNRRHEPHIYNWSASAPEIPWQGPRCCPCVCAHTYSFIAVQVRAQ